MWYISSGGWQNAAILKWNNANIILPELLRALSNKLMTKTTEWQVTSYWTTTLGQVFNLVPCIKCLKWPLSTLMQACRCFWKPRADFWMLSLEMLPVLHKTCFLHFHLNVKWKQKSCLQSGRGIIMSRVYFSWYLAGC